ncbi:pilin [Pseudomonas coleopterorum]|uniref:pilin n=1 Tax=Pseudomonas coleopterorum TaxID=1605838 RepID=UPI000899AE57|nr:pilin [Pseudomonas coleopterorum]SEE62761.1 prepilin-type N-terminal cleavage/methylation domain-containing protein [Pseudomonas coleopterorum]
MRGQKAFTLIEIMMVVLVLGVLVVVALPTYSRYVCKSKVAASFQELVGLRAIYESALSVSAPVPTLEELTAIQNRSARCAFSTMSDNTKGTANLECRLLNAPSAVQDGVITVVRALDGSWVCYVNSKIGSDYRPEGCTENFQG